MSIDAVGNFGFAALTLGAMLVLAALGLAIIYGMMGVINLAHGAFLTLGAYMTLEGVSRGLSLWVAIAVAGVIVGAFGAIIELILVRRLYGGRLAESLLATWGLSLVMVPVLQEIYGTATPGLKIPFGSFHIGRYSESVYSIVLVLVALLVLAGVYLLLQRSNYGLRARATTQIPAMASAVGINSARVNTCTFALGSALAGLGGGLLTPVLGVSPTMGDSYLAQAFMVVVVGGPAMLVGVPAASGLLAFSSQLVTTLSTAFFGAGAFLITAILSLRFLPDGITGKRR